MPLTAGTRLGVYDIVDPLGAPAAWVAPAASKPVTMTHVVLNWAEELERLVPAK